ncbi:hypothetical protein FFLO_01019 [Filobasidium floriforme]|uniref:Metallo-beta-lactamase domain-containing protein n=1 Tax=Filobasidium floriforme TaxID=5210 RepID=A0A8K0JS08_9TREE|nr:hypothetical protein FFLO_01019 [Filobasidium floriforme]
MSSTLDLLFLGSGASAPVPELRCLVRPKKSPLGPCNVCLEAQSNPVSKNIRGCTSGVIVKQWDDGRRSTILIDSGKTFLSSAVKQLPRNDISRVDAVFLSHIHADATQGLDDLRMFTLANEIQTSIDVYADRATYDAVARRYP